MSTSEDNVHVAELSEELRKIGIASAIINFDPILSIAQSVKALGSVTFWRGSSLHNKTQRSAIAAHLDETFMVNEAVFLHPNVAEKYYQQHVVMASPALRPLAIPTYRVKNRKGFERLVSDGLLRYPVIAKPNGGCRGEGVVLVKSANDVTKLQLSVGEYVFQDFIENDGDWRVIVVGGRPLGAMKRIARPGSYLNNISQGASAIAEQDPEVLTVLYKLAPKLAAHFRLRFCGVDIVRSKETGEYKFLEVNTMPQWRNEEGFSNTTGVSVARELADYAQTVLALKASTNLNETVDNYFKKSLELYPDERFHYASRRWLWSRDEWSRAQLDALKGWYIGEDETAQRDKIRQLIAKKDEAQNVNQRRAYRRKYYDMYQKLPLYNTLLFRYLFTRTLYNEDIRPYILEYVSDEELRELAQRLQRDDDAMRVLSTHAVNFLYLLQYYIGEACDPYRIIELSKAYDTHIASGELSKEAALKLKIYLLTHAIIGESAFYCRSVDGDAYAEMCQIIEKTIEENYFNVSLDNKFEFLVCAALTRYPSKLRSLILQEAERSVSWTGPFLVDQGEPALRHIVQTAEHRNVLYVMASETDKFQVGKIV